MYYACRGMAEGAGFEPATVREHGWPIISRLHCLAMLPLHIGNRRSRRASLGGPPILFVLRIRENTAKLPMWVGGVDKEQ